MPTALPDRPGFLILLAAYVGVMVFIGWLGRKKTQGVEDYYVGGRSMGGFLVGLSFFATYASTNSYLGFSSKAYSYGPLWLLLMPFAVGFSWLSWFAIAPRLRTMSAELDSVTIPDFIGFRYRSTAARTMAATIVLVASLLYMTAVYKGIGNLLEILLGMSYLSSIALVFLVVVIYTSVGGFHSVVRTDAVQAVFMLIAAVLLFRGVTKAAGGIDTIMQSSSPRPAILSWQAAQEGTLPFGILLGVLVASTIKFLVEPRQLSRFYALRDPGEAKRGIWVSTLLFVVVFSLLTPLGLYGRLLFDSLADTDRMIPTLITNGDFFGPAAQAVLLLALISAAMSSLDSVLLVTASTCQRDLVERIWQEPSESQRLRSTRVQVIVFALAAAALALDPPGGIVELTAFSGALYGACFLPTMVFGLYTRRTEGAMVLSSMVTGAVVLILWQRIAATTGIHQVFPAIAASFLGYLLAGFLTRNRATEIE